MAYGINELLKRLVRTRTVGYLFLDRNMSWLLMLLTSPVVGCQIPTDICLVWSCLVLLSVLWRCWLGGRKGIRPVKTERWGAGVVICVERGADLHMTQLMPLPLTVSCFSEIQIGFTFLVPAYPGSPGQRAVKRCVCVCVCVCVLSYLMLSGYRDMTPPGLDAASPPPPPLPPKLGRPLSATLSLTTASRSVIPVKQGYCRWTGCSLKHVSIQCTG